MEIQYLRDTKPSDYDTDKPWCMTIGKYEYEQDAKHITRYCQEHGDKWQPVPPDRFDYRTEPLEMCEWWLERLQCVRVKLEGPPELIANTRARGGLQLRHPNRQIWAAAHTYTDAEMATLRAHLTQDPSPLA